MCNRIVFEVDEEELADAFNAWLETDPQPITDKSFNIAPTDQATIIRAAIDRDQEPAKEKGRVLEHVRWGLVPSWSKSIETGFLGTNARDDEALKKPMYKRPLKSRRAIMPISGFYEWKKGSKQPYHFRAMGGSVLPVAAIWDSWKQPDETRLHSCCMFTTSSNETMSPIHHRMPAILMPDAIDVWLDPAFDDLGALRDMLKPYPGDLMEFYPVSVDVNSVHAGGPHLIKKLEESARPPRQETLTLDF